MRLPVSRTLPLAALILLNACLGAEDEVLSNAPKSGPAADYPVVVGSPFVIDGTTFTPIDSMNYDAVGRAVVAPVGGEGITAAHHTLPLPSYVEVTALETGTTILVRVERRGPAAAKPLIELSPGAAAQLGLAGPGTASVRVRRVNPVEAERALLRSGQAAPIRMDTPRSLLGVLQRKLDNQEGVIRAPEAAAPEPALSLPPAAAAKVQAKIKPSQSLNVAPAPAPKPAAVPGGFVIQIGAFSSKVNAAAAAKQAGGNVVQSGKFWTVRLGPFASQNQAQAALAKARATGYSDARILRVG